MPAHGKLKELEDTVRRTYLLADPYITKFLVAEMITQNLACDPAWSVIIAPPGGGKSEFVNMLSQCLNVHAISTLTARTFVSGQRTTGHKDVSLLTKIQNGIITFKDMTSLLSENRDEQSIIMAQLREIFDGKYNKLYGTGEEVAWKGKITIVAGATYKIHRLRQNYAAMGERFLFYNFIQPNSIEAARRNMENQEAGIMAERRAELAKLWHTYIDETLKYPKTLPPLHTDLQNELLDLAELATRARSETERNWRSPQQEIIDVPPVEIPTRFAGSLMAIANALKVINWNETGSFELLPEDKKILYKISLDSITRSKRIAMQELAKYDVLQTAGLATKLGFPTNTVRRWLEDLVALEVAVREIGSGPRGDRWTILPKYRLLIEKYEGIARENHELIETKSDPQAMEEELEALSTSTSTGE